MAKSSARSVIFSNTERRISPRSRGGVAAQLGLHGGRRVQRGDRVLGGGVGDGDQHLVVGRVEHVERRRRLALLTADPQAGGNGLSAARWYPYTLIIYTFVK